MRKKSNQMLQHQEFLNIVLWGPSGAGKDYLINGFIIETNTSGDSKNRYFYSITLGNEKIIPGTTIPESVPSTANAESRRLEFTRQCREETSQKLNPYHIQHFHHVVIHNNRGGELVDVTNGKSTDPTITALFELANNFIVVLDKPSNEDKKNSNESGSDAQTINGNDVAFLLDSEKPQKIRTYSIKYYQDSLKMFFDHLKVSKSEAKTYIAICLTKADRYGLEGDPKVVLSQCFGPETLSLIERYQADYNIRIFLTTTEGFRNVKADPNNPKFLKPTNTASPFFWFFEEAEKDRLSENCPRILVQARLSESNYVPYPAPES